MNTVPNWMICMYGAIIFFVSIYIGENTIMGGLMHLSGCSIFCLGVHRKFHLH